MSNNVRKKELLVEVQKPRYIYKKLDTGEDMTIMTCTYMLPWKKITNVNPFYISLLNFDELNKAFPDANIKYIWEKDCFIFNVKGVTKRHLSDTFDKKIGDKIVKAKALARACVISKAIIKEIITYLTKELDRTYDIFNVWHSKEQYIMEEYNENSNR